MDSSTFATIFIVVLAVIFVFLVVMTIVLIASAGKKKASKQKQMKENNKKQDSMKKEEDSIFAEADEDYASDREEDDAFAESEDKIEADSAFSANADEIGADSAFSPDADEIGEDSAFSANADETGADSAFSPDVDEIGEDSAFSSDAGIPSAYEEAAATGSAFAENIPVRPDSAFSANVDEIGEDSAFSADAGIPSAYEEAAATGSAFAENIPVQSDSAFSEDRIPEPKQEAEAEWEPGTELESEPKSESESETAFSKESEQQMNPASQEKEVLSEEPSEETVNLLEEIGTDSAFGPDVTEDTLSNEELSASVREALNAARAVGAIGENPDAVFGVSEELAKYSSKKKVHKKSTVASDDDFYWYNLLDVSEKPSYKTAEMYYHYFNIASDCIDDLLMEMYDCALVRTEEIRYIAYGISPKAVSMREILTSGNIHYMEQKKLKEPSTQDLVRIYEKWCSYVDNLFDKIEIHADEFTINEIRNRLYEFGRNDVDVILEGR